MKTILASAAALALALSGSAAFAQSAALDSGFDSVDTDRSGTVTWTEFSLIYTDITEEQFNTADLDGNGELSMEEFDALVGSTGSIAPAPAPTEDAPIPGSLTYDPDGDA